MFVQGGDVDPGDYLSSAGREGYYWSSIGSGSYSAYNLVFDQFGASPSYGYGARYAGYSVRCVALGGWAQYVMLCLFFIG